MTVERNAYQELPYLSDIHVFRQACLSIHCRHRSCDLGFALFATSPAGYKIDYMYIVVKSSGQVFKVLPYRSTKVTCGFDLYFYRPQWRSWMRRPTGDQEVAGSTPAEVGNILSWRLIRKYFLRSFSPFP